MALPIRNFDTRKYVRQSPEDKAMEEKLRQNRTSSSQQALSNTLVSNGINNLNPNVNQMQQTPVRQQ